MYNNHQDQGEKDALTYVKLSMRCSIYRDLVGPGGYPGVCFHMIFQIGNSSIIIFNNGHEMAHEHRSTLVFVKIFVSILNEIRRQALALLIAKVLKQRGVGKNMVLMLRNKSKDGNGIASLIVWDCCCWSALLLPRFKIVMSDKNC